MDDQTPGAVKAPLEAPVRPRAWVWKDEPSGIEIYSGWDEPRPTNGSEPLYDQAAIDAALTLLPRDCRLCAHFRDGLTHAAHCVSVLRCKDSSAYRATQPVQFWEKRPAEPAPF